MTWTYDATVRTDLNIVREKIGDTNSAAELLQNETISEKLTLFSDDTVLAAMACVRLILAKIARNHDRSAIGFSGSRSQATKHYQDLLGTLEDESNSGAGGTGGPETSIGGTSVEDKEDLESDTDYRESPFDWDDD